MKTMKTILIFIFVFFTFNQTSAQEISFECDMACAVVLYNEAGDSRLKIVIANCEVIDFSEPRFRIARVSQETICDCKVRAYCGYGQKGRNKSFNLGSGASLNLPFGIRSVKLECSL